MRTIRPRDVQLIFRPIGRWPNGELTPDGQRKTTPFQASYDQTLSQLREEATFLDCNEVIIQVGLTEADFRIDGTPRAKAEARHPGVIVSMMTKHGPIELATDAFHAPYYSQGPHWVANLRAIVLGLENLRRLDRYGITKHGEQYTGWKQLAARPMGFDSEDMSEEDAARLLAGAIERTRWEDLLTDSHLEKQCYRVASQLVHPDTGEADQDKFKKLQRAHELLTRRR